MTRAEQRANEKYPLMQEGDIEGLDALKYIGMECDSVYEFNSVRYSQQAYFIEGYQQAEKDFIEKATKLFGENLKKLGFLKDERESMVNKFKEAMNNENDND